MLHMMLPAEARMLPADTLLHPIAGREIVLLRDADRIQIIPPAPKLEGTARASPECPSGEKHS